MKKFLDFFYLEDVIIMQYSENINIIKSMQLP